MTLLIKDIDVAAPDTSCKLTVGLKVESDRTNCDISDNENGKSIHQLNFISITPYLLYFNRKHVDMFISL
jgi:hypothetical protein